MITNISINRIERIEGEDGLFCCDDCIATISKFMNCNYELMYTEGYTLKKELTSLNSKKRLTSKYSIYLNNRYKNLSKYHGLFIKDFQKNKNPKWFKIIKKELKYGRPLMLTLDPFWCPWDPWFKKYSNDIGHSFIIKGISKKNLVCLDPYFNIETIILPFNLFLKGVLNIKCFYKKNIIDSFPIDLEVVDNIFSSLNNDFIKNLTFLFEEIEKSPNIFFEVLPNENFINSNIFVLFMLINQSFRTTSIAMNFLSNKFYNDSKLYSKTKLIGNQLWNLSVNFKKSRNLLTKFFYSRNEETKLKLIMELKFFLFELNTNIYNNFLALKNEN